MNAFIRKIEECDKLDSVLRRTKLERLQVNMGDLCNQSCRHCHVDASPAGQNIISKDTIDDVVKFLSKNKVKVLDITGGAPELNPNFEYLLEQTSELVQEIIVRSNLTVICEPGLADIIKVYKKYKVHLVGSLPCYLKENVDKQRGEKSFEKNIDTLRKLNTVGYGVERDLVLDLVYNPAGPFLPPAQHELEPAYKKELLDKYCVVFNNLLTITNVAIKRFKSALESSGEYGNYISLLEENFNCTVVESLMCRTFLSVGYDGKLYDCDFNQALGWSIKQDGKELTISNISLEQLEGQQVQVGTHCLACTAGSGSSCSGTIQ